MPKTDPVTGCQVMTQAEFWVGEADREGKGRCAGELIEDFWDEWQAEEEKEVDRLKDPEHAFDILKSTINDWIEYDPDFVEEAAIPIPTEVVRVLNAEFGATISSNKTVVKVIAKAEDGELYVYDVWFAYWSGTMMDPPEEDSDISWIPLKCVIL